MKKYNTFKLILLLAALMATNSTQAQFITLKGKQFIDQSGTPFYPLVCNYFCYFNCNTCTYDNDCTFSDAIDPTDIAFMPDQNNYITSSGGIPTFGNGLPFIKAAFNKIKSMGFNTVRLGGWTPQINGLTSTSTDNPTYTFTYCNSFAHYIGTDVCPSYASYNFTAGYPIIFQEPFSTDNNINNIFLPQLKNVLQLASDAGLNVILLCAGGYASLTDADAGVTQDMLVAISSSLAGDAGGHPEILAYELYNEPHFQTTEPTYVNFNPQMTNIKNKICTYTSNWYAAIKAVDPNHLITMGNIGPDDVMDWDPAILKLDFNSFHPYPQYYITAYDGYSQANAISRYNAMLYWINNNCPMPWIIGETGVTACSATSASGALPSIWGTLDDQTSFALQSQQMVLNNGGSGYSWWDFSDDDKLPTAAYSGSYGPWFGLLYQGKPVDLGGGNYAYDNTYDKPIVANAFGSKTVTHSTAQITMPSNYYNAWGGSYYTFSGTVVDQDGNPIKDAVIKGTNFGSHWSNNLHPNSTADLIEVPEDKVFSIETFSKADGTFSLIAPISSPPLFLISPPYLDYDYGKFDKIRISAPTSSVFTWDVADHEPSGSPSSGTISLHRNANVFDNTVRLQDINGSNSSSSTLATTAARHELVTGASQVEPTGYADFHASSLVDVWGISDGGVAGFVAEKGSYTHIYCAPVNFDCGQLSEPDVYLHRQAPKVSKINTIRPEIMEPDITVNYLLPSKNISLMPNPAENYIYLLGPGDLPEGDIIITDGLGHSIYRGKASLDGQTPFKTSELAPGYYNVHVTCNAINENLKLIITR